MSNIVEPLDMHGVPIRNLDLIRMEHFRDRRGRIYFMYHVVFFRENGVLEAVPIGEAVNGLDHVGKFWIKPGDSICDAIEVLCSTFNGQHVADRPRHPR